MANSLQNITVILQNITGEEIKMSEKMDEMRRIATSLTTDKFSESQMLEFQKIIEKMYEDFEGCERAIAVLMMSNLNLMKYLAQSGEVFFKLAQNDEIICLTWSYVKQFAEVRKG